MEIKKLDKFLAEKNGELHYCDIVGFINNAKFCELEEEEAFSIYSEHYAGSSKWEDNFRKVWRSGKADPEKTISDYKKNASSSNEEESITESVEFNKNFLNFIKTAKNFKMDFDVRDTSLLKYFFKEGDWIHIVSDKFDKCTEAKDCYTLIKAEQPLKKFQFMSLAAFKDPLMRKEK